MQGLLVCAGDVGNAFLYGVTHEKYFIIAGAEFGPEVHGKCLVIHKSLYGLKSSAARFHENLSVKLRALNFKPTKVDSDLWMKDCGTHYEYIAHFVDNVIAFSKDPMHIMQELERTYVMKGVGTPQYYLGGDVMELGAPWDKEGIYTAFSAETYITNCLKKLATMCGIQEFVKHKTPMDSKYHLELDESPLCSLEGRSKYHSLIGSTNWIIILGRFDISYAVTTLAHYSMAPHEGHFSELQ